ncbi:MAG TPA: serine hydrolase, partial [Candidatus Acidoferrales bacterium]|nr:serine hydrolase [Candidatus Acidoferrales bacterium]
TPAAPATQPQQLVAKDFQSALEQRVAGSPGVGIIVAVIDHGDVTIFKAGSSGTSRPLDDRTLFEVGSVTKTFTATILASMVEDGSVSLDDPVSKFLPANVTVPSRDGKQITLLELATQHSGLPRLPSNLNPANPQDPYADYSLDDMYAFLNSYQLPRDPGVEFEYSNFGVGLLGEALAGKAGMPYATLLRDRVLAPLDMQDTVVVTTPTLQPYLAIGHDADGNETPPWTFEAIAPAGAIRSDLADMLKYLRCNMGQGPLAKTCLYAQQPRDTFTGHQIGLIWWTDDTTKIVGHGGDTAGYHAWVGVTPDRTRGVVVLTNGGTPVEDVGVHALDPSAPMSEPEQAIHLDPSVLRDYVGIYKGWQGQNLTFTIKLVGDTLQAQLTGQPFANIYPSAKDHFFYRIVNAQIDFTRDANGKVNALVLHQDGNTIVAARAGMNPPPNILPSFPPLVTLDSQTLASYVGTYMAGQGLSFTVTLSSDQLMVQLTGQPAVPVYASAKDHFFYKVVDAQIDFERGADGSVQDLILHQNGQNIKAIKAVASS